MQTRLATSTDESLVLALAQRDEAALRALYERHAPAVFALAQRIVGHRDLAEEIVQELFLRLWNEPARYQPERGKLRSYLFRQAHSRSIERIRSEEARRRREERADRELAEPAYDIEREAWALIESEVVRDALADLAPGEREAIELAYFGGHTYREVAVLLDVPEGTVKSRIRIGLSKLQVVLAAAGLAMLVVVLLLVGGAVAGSHEPSVATADGQRTATTISRTNLRNADGMQIDVIVAGDGRAVVAPVSVPALDEDHVFQLWSLDGQLPAAVGVFRAETTELPIDRGNPPRHLAVTIEPVGGSAAPTTTPLVEGLPS